MKFPKVSTTLATAAADVKAGGLTERPPIVHVVAFTPGFGWHTLTPKKPLEFLRMNATERENHVLACYPAATEWHLVEKAISVRQPWAYGIKELGKDRENRNRKMARPGWYYLHASAGDTRAQYERAVAHIKATVPGVDHIPKFGSHKIQRGGIIALFQITGWTKESGAATNEANPWFMGPTAAVLDNIHPLDFYPCPGGQGVFYPNKKLRDAIEDQRHDDEAADT